MVFKEVVLVCLSDGRLSARDPIALPKRPQVSPAPNTIVGFLVGKAARLPVMQPPISELY